MRLLRLSLLGLASVMLFLKVSLVDLPIATTSNKVPRNNTTGVEKLNSNISDTATNISGSITFGNTLLTTSPATDAPAAEAASVKSMSNWNSSICHHNHPSFPIDISCRPKIGQTTTANKWQRRQCYRHCDINNNNNNTSNNKIVLTHRSMAGISDRQTVFKQLTDLAGYLCATLYVPIPPSILLAPRHNQGNAVDESVEWADLLDFQFYKDETRVNATRRPAFTETRGLQNTVLLAKTEEHYTHRMITSHAHQIVEHFHQAINASLQQDGGESFVWDINQSWYALRKPLIEYMEHMQDTLDHNNSNASSSSLCLPIAHDDHHSYVQMTEPVQLQAMANTIWNNTILQTTTTTTTTNATENATMLIGSWHIRRGDSKRQCDTSLVRMKQYIDCTFANITQNGIRQNITVLLFSDEQDPNYRQEIAHLLGQHHIHTISLDDVVRTHLQEQGPPAYRNNYHEFIVINLLANKATAFQLSHRRSYDCQDCYDLAGHIKEKI